VRPPQQSDLDVLRRWAVLLDSFFRVPGTNIRFGLDAIIGLVPGLGDLVAPVFTVAVLATGLKMRVPAVVQARMVLNAALLERHARPGVVPTRGDYLFVLICIGVVLLIAAIPVLLLLWLLSQFSFF
jgi:hypothetical protein